MNFLARILSHGFAIAIVALLVIGFMYRGELFPEWDLPDLLTSDADTLAQEEDATGTVDRSTADVRSAGEVQDAFPEPGPAAPDRVMSEAEVSARPDQEAIPEAVSESMAKADAVQDLVRDDMPQPTFEEQAAGQESEAEPGDEGEGAPEDEADELPQAPAPGGKQAAAIPTAESAESKGEHYQLLANAREAFWLRNYEEAEDLYNRLTELEPENSDGYGELANMYYTQGRWEEAAAAYYAAGVRLVRTGRLQQASQLVKVIRGLDGDQADDLEKQISAAR